MCLPQPETSTSRAALPVYHTGQGQDERAPTHPCPSCTALTQRGFEALNPHRESGTRSRAAADVGQAAARKAHTLHEQLNRCIGDRFGDSVGQNTGTTKSAVAPHSMLKWPPNLTIIPTIWLDHGPDSHGKLGSNIIDKNSRVAALLSTLLVCMY
jgi:hypothetical protein